MLLKQIKFRKKEERRKKEESWQFTLEALKYNRRIYVGTVSPAGEVV